MPRTNIAPKQDKGHVRRAKLAKESKIIENTKNALCIRGKKTSDEVGTLLKDMVSLTLACNGSMSLFCVVMAKQSAQF
jgi:hypothetical protein